jgi:hypothetical protein
MKSACQGQECGVALKEIHGRRLVKKRNTKIPSMPPTILVIIIFGFMNVYPHDRFA